MIVPEIRIDSIEYLNPFTSSPLGGRGLRPGESVLVRVTASTVGRVASVAATPRLDSESDPSNGIVYDRHLSNTPVDHRRVFGTGTQEFDWTWRVPETATSGRYQASVLFRDVLCVLGFKDSGWQAAFAVQR